MPVEHRPAISIAPTNAGQHDGTAASGQSVIDRFHSKPKITGLTVSKQWVLPPRPKPGRKPKPKPPKPAKPSQSSQTSKFTVQSAKTITKENSKSYPSNQTQINQPIANQSKILNSPKNSPLGIDSPLGTNSPLAINSPSSTNSSACMSSFNGISSPVSVPSKPTSHTDDDCGLCSRDDCMCETIGLKQNTVPPAKRQRLPSLDTILNSTVIPMDAIPLKRTAAAPALSISRPTKFSRFTDFSPMHPAPAFSVPSPLEGLGDGCGFCTENTPCACAEASKVSYKECNPIKPSQTGKENYNDAESLAPNKITNDSSRKDPGDVKTDLIMKEEDVFSCGSCEKDAMSMLFCLSLTSAKPLTSGAVSIPCHLAARTLQKHPKFEGCDLGRLVRQLEVNGKQVGVQSINRVLQDLDRGIY